MIAEPGWVGYNVGDSVDITDDAVIRGDRGLAALRGVFIPVARVPVKTGPAFVKEVARLFAAAAESLAVDGAGGDLRKRLGLDASGVDGKVDKNEDDDEDVRTLPVTWDEQSVRYKAWRDVCAGSVVHTWSDFPLEGPVTSLDLSKHMQKFGGDPSNWMLQSAREKHIQATDRTWHELRVLTQSLQSFGSYDQLNLGACAGVEIICRRIQAIADAHSVPGRVDWSNGKYFAGQGDVGDAVSSQLRQWVARRAKDDAEIDTARERARAVQSRAASAGDQASSVAANPKVEPRPKKTNRLGAPGDSGASRP